MLYDLAAITDLMQQDSEVGLLGNLLYLSLVHIYASKDGNCQSKDHQVSFDHYWKLAKGHLTLEKLCNLLKPNRTNSSVVESLLKTIFIMLKDASADQSESPLQEDMVHMLRDLIAKEQQNMNVVKLAGLCLVKLTDIFPSLKQQCLGILRELIASLQEVIRSQFGSKDDSQIPGGSNEFDVSLIVLNCKKFNQLLTSVSLASVNSIVQVSDWNNYVISQVYGLLERPNVINGLTHEQIVTMLQLPVECLKQLYHPRPGFEQKREEVNAQMTISNSLLERCLDLLNNPSVNSNADHSL